VSDEREGESVQGNAACAQVVLHKGRQTESYYIVRRDVCSNIPAWQIVKANGISTQMNLEKFACGQYMYNLINRDKELSKQVIIWVDRLNATHENAPMTGQSDS
jgi:hypothetical protein